jgi:hypothetical protein
VVSWVRAEIAELTAVSEDDDSTRRAEIEALKRRIAELFLECEGNPYAGELMGRGLHSELAGCRRCGRRSRRRTAGGWQLDLER